jgi:hypothetical protein
MGDREVEILLHSAKAALEGSEVPGAQFLIPDGDRRWHIFCSDLDAVGQNDLGIPPKVFAHGAVGTLLQALGAHECYVAEAVTRPTPAVVVTAFKPGRLEVGVHPYTTAASGQISWGEPALTSTEQPGSLGSALPLWRAVNRERSPMPPPDQLIEDMVDSGFVVMLEGGNGGG